MTEPLLATGSATPVATDRHPTTAAARAAIRDAMDEARRSLGAVVSADGWSLLIWQGWRIA